MPINQDLLTRIEESADDWGPNGRLGNDPQHVRYVEESKNLDDALGLHPISIRLPKELVRDLKAIAHINGMGYQPLMRTVLSRFVDAERKAILRDQAIRRKQELERQLEAAKAAAEAEASAAAALAAEEEAARAAAAQSGATLDERLAA